MTMETIPWGVSGGITSASIGRLLANVASGGEEGVAGIGDLIVTQTTVASGKVRVGPGGAILRSRYVGARNESYVCRAGDVTEVDVPPNTTNAMAYRMIVVRIDDWNMPGGQARPASLPTDSVAVSKLACLTITSGTFRRFSQLGYSYPGLALAVIAIPPNTSAITQQMITDVREKAVPRRRRDLRPLSLAAGSEDTLTAATAFPQGESWPDKLQTIEVPDWATEMRVIGQWNQIFTPAGGCKGFLWVKLGWGRPDERNSQGSVFDSTKTASDAARMTCAVADTLYIPSTMRGESVYIGLWATLSGAIPAANRPTLDASSSIYIDIEFIEAATEDL